MRTNPPLRILVVDDHPLIRESMTILLNQQEDMEVCAQATNGAEALHLFRVHQPDVTLMDLHMPVINGVAATRFICQEFPDACVFAITAEAETAEMKEVLQAGAKDCFSKWEAVGVLLHAIRRYCQTLRAPTNTV